MINVIIKDKEAEDLFAEFLEPKVKQFCEQFGSKVSFELKNNKPQVDIWLGIEREELDSLRSKEKFIEYLKRKQHYAEELKKRAMTHHDRFESYEIVIDLLACFLANKPVKDTTSIPTMKDIDGFIDGVTPSLEAWDLIAFRELKEFVLKIIKEDTGKQAIKEGYEKVFGKTSETNC